MTQDDGMVPLDGFIFNPVQHKVVLKDHKHKQTAKTRWPDMLVRFLLSLTSNLKRNEKKNCINPNEQILREKLAKESKIWMDSNHNNAISVIENFVENSQCDTDKRNLNSLNAK